MALPTAAQVWSKYLFNTDKAPTGASLLNESLIRPASTKDTPVKGVAIQISALDRAKLG